MLPFGVSPKLGVVNKPLPTKCSKKKLEYYKQAQQTLFPSPLAFASLRFHLKQNMLKQESQLSLLFASEPWILIY